jgi:hypothetical protein
MATVYRGRDFGIRDFQSIGDLRIQVPSICGAVGVHLRGHSFSTFTPVQPDLDHDSIGILVNEFNHDQSKSHRHRLGCGDLII